MEEKVFVYITRCNLCNDNYY